MMQKIKTFMFFLFSGIILASCAGPPEIAITKDTVHPHPMPRVEYEYELGPGDVIEIIYHYTPTSETQEYYLAVGDVFKVEFSYHKDINRTLTVRPDGSVTLSRKGSVKVLGLTPTQLQEKITDLYSFEFKDPVVTVTMIQFNRAIDHLKKAITTAPRGQSKLTAVRPDGYISFPMLSDILARGKTMPALRDIVTKEYSKLIDNLTISLILKVMKANFVFIMGEVAKPDYYIMEGPQTVTQIISRAGGFLNTAETETILVISRDDQRRPWGRLLNLKKILKQGNISEDFILQQYDIVYVPKSVIARRNLFVEQYINKMIPANLLEPYNLGGTLIDNRPLIR